MNPPGFPTTAVATGQSQEEIAVALSETTASPPFRASRMPQLDALRTFAVMAVIVSHTMTFRGHLFGTYGVTLFFVLSGFLITGILLQCRDQATVSNHSRITLLRQFYIRRFLRIFPLYYLVLTILFVCRYEPVVDNAFWFFGYLANFRVADPAIWASSVTHFWSLAVEEQFYLIWPWIVFWLPPRILPWFAMAMVATGPISRAIGASAGMTQHELWVAPLSCLDALGMGAILAIAERRGWMAQIRRFSLFSGVGLTALLLLCRLKLPTAAPALWSLGPALLAAWLVASAARGFTGTLGRLATWGPILWTGTICYGIYVYHLPIIMLAHQTGYVEHDLALFLTVTITSVGIAALSWYVFERPINELKRHFPYAPKKMVHAPSSL